MPPVFRIGANCLHFNREPGAQSGNREDFVKSYTRIIWHASDRSCNVSIRVRQEARGYSAAVYYGQSSGFGQMRRTYSKTVPCRSTNAEDAFASGLALFRETWEQGGYYINALVVNMGLCPRDDRAPQFQDAHAFVPTPGNPAKCAQCSAEPDYPTHSLTLPGMDDVDAARALAGAEAQGVALSNRVSREVRSVDLATRQIEQRSPLFRDSEANPQGSLFAPLPPQTPHATCNGCAADLSAIPSLRMPDGVFCEPCAAVSHLLDGLTLIAA